MLPTAVPQHLPELTDSLEVYLLDCYVFVTGCEDCFLSNGLQAFLHFSNQLDRRVRVKCLPTLQIKVDRTGMSKQCAIEIVCP